MPKNKSDKEFIYLQIKIKQLMRQMIKNSKHETYILLEMLTTIPKKHLNETLVETLEKFINSKDGDIDGDM